MLLPKKSLLPVLMSLLFFTSCSSDDNSTDNHSVFAGHVTEDVLQRIFASDVDNVIIPSTKSLASSAEKSQASIIPLEYGAIAQTQFAQAASDFLQMRFDYEKTEGMFFGANSHFDIDADINSWPLDQQRFNELMKDSTNDLMSLSNLPSSIVGFHGLEYIFYRNGNVRDVSDLTKREITYAKTIANDLRLRSYQFECGWSTNASIEYTNVLQSAGVKYSSPDGSDYRTYMLAHYTGKQLASAMLVGDHGMGGLSDEIANTKLRIPHDRNDSTYIESPFSRKSLEDLEYNLQSIDNLWRGTTESGKVEEWSFSNYFKTYNPELATKIDTAISSCFQALQNIDTPFVIHYKDQSVTSAIAIFDQLTDALGEANDYIQNQ